MTACCAPACSQALPVKPGGSGSEVLMRERGHVTAANGVAEVAAFGALQRNVIIGYIMKTETLQYGGFVDVSCI